MLDIFNRELKQILHDGGVMIIFIVAGFLYPILYNYVYKNGILEDTPVAVVDQACCSDSRRMIREMDATRELNIAYRCTDLEEAKALFQERKVNGIILFPEDFGEKLAMLRMRKHVSWYLAGRRGAAKWRAAANSISTMEELRSLLLSWAEG
jgi:ABC-2 type transport system permease protein